MLGVIYNNKSDYDMALEFYMKALTIRENVLGKKHPATAYLYNNIAWTLHSSGQDAKALPYALKAVEAIPDNYYMIDTLAETYQKIGKNNEALEQFELCLKLQKEQNASEESIHEMEKKIAVLKAKISK